MSFPALMRQLLWLLLLVFTCGPLLLRAQFTTNGTAASLGGDCFRVTSAIATQSGSVWSNTPVNLNAPFDLKGQMFLGCSDAGADGMTFALQTTGTGALGTAGGSLGYAGIPTSIAVEFDTYQNASPYSDPVADHLALISGGSVDHAAATNLAGPVSILPGGGNIEDCQYHDVRFTWDPNNLVFEVYVDCQLRLTYNGDIRTALGGASTATYGFTGGTGGLSNLQQACFLSGSLPGSNTPLTLCQGDSLTLTAGVGSEYNWNPSFGLTAITGQSVQAFPSIGIVYTVSYTDACGFSIQDTFPITVSPVNNIPVDLGPDFTLCPLEDSVLDPGLPATFTYLWQNGSTGPTFNANGPGTYFVEVRDGCNVGRDTIVIGQSTLPTPVFALQDSVCLDELSIISLTSPVIPGANYNWNLDGATLIGGGPTSPQQVFWSTPGTKTVCLNIDRLGCSVGPTCENIVVKPRPQVFLNPVPNQCFPDTGFVFEVIGDTVDTYIWNFGISATPPTFSGPNPPPVTYADTGVKVVSLLVFNDGCQADSAVTTTFEVLEVPEALFSPSSGEICANETVDFTYNGSILSPNQQFSWDFGSAALPSSSTLPNPFPVTYLTGGSKVVTLTVSNGGCTSTYTDTIIVKASPIINAGPDTSFCEGDGGVQLLGTSSGGTAPVAYVWSCDQAPNCGFDFPNVLQPNVNPDVISPTENVVFYLQAIDASGCPSNLDSVLVTVKAKPRVEAGPDRLLCPAPDTGSFLLGGPAATNQVPIQSYQWIPAAGLNNPNIASPYARPDTTTIYTLIATGINGCTSEATTLDTTSTAAVIVKDKPIAFAGQDTGICFRDSILLQGFASGAGPNYEFFWTGSPGGSLSDPNSPTPIATPGQTTIYTLTVVSNGCSSDGDDLLIEVDTKPTVNPGPDRGVCQFQPLQLDARSAGDINADSYDYQWFPVTGLSDPTIPNPLATPDQTTTYSVFSISEFGCQSDTQTVLVFLEPTPIVNLLAEDSTVCEDDTLTLRANHTFGTSPSDQVNYNWYPSDFDYAFIYDSVVQVSPTRNGFIVVETVVSSGKCPSRDSIFMVVNPAITATTFFPDTNRICQGTATQLAAEGGLGNASFSWSPSIGLDDSTLAVPTASPDVTTTYVVTVSEGACEAQDSLTLEISPAPLLDFVYDLPRGCGVLDMGFADRSINAVTLIWDFGDGSPLSNARDPEHVYQEPGQYTVQLIGISEEGCVDSLSRGPVEVFPINQADFVSTPDTSEAILPTTDVQFTDASTGAAAWLWAFGDGQMSTEANPIHQYNQSGSYEVSLTITDSVGCTYTIQYGPYEVLLPDALLPTVFTPNGDGINDAFRVSYGGDESFLLSIRDRWGREAFRSEDPDEGWNGTYPDGSEALNGVYFYVVNIGSGYFQRTLTLLR